MIDIQKHPFEDVLHLGDILKCDIGIVELLFLHLRVDDTVYQLIDLLLIRLAKAPRGASTESAIITTRFPC